MEATGWSADRWAILGEAIAKARRAKGWDQQELSNRSGNSANTISNYERGRASRSRRIPGGYVRVAYALGWAEDVPIRILSGESPESVIDQPTLFDARFVERKGPGGISRSMRTRDALSVPPDVSRLSSRDIELTESGYLAQDVFMRQEKRYRKLNDVTAGEVVQRVNDLGGDLSVTDLERLENGTRLLGVAESQLIAQALGTTVEWLLGSGFSSEAPEEMKVPPNAVELEAEAKAVERRLGEVGGQVLSARHQEMQARRAYEMAASMLATVRAHERELERNYQYLLGRIDSLRAAAGEPTIIETIPVYEGDENRAREDNLDSPPF